MKCGWSTCKKVLLAMAFVLVISAAGTGFSDVKISASEGIKEDSWFGRSSNFSKLLGDTISNWVTALASSLTHKLSVNILITEHSLSSRALKTLPSIQDQYTVANRLKIAKSTYLSGAVVVKPFTFRQSSPPSEARLLRELLSLEDSPDPVPLSFVASSPMPSHTTDSSTHTSAPSNPLMAPSSFSPTVTGDPAELATGGLISAPLQAPLNSNAPNFFHSSPPGVSIRNEAPSSLVASSSEPGPINPQAFSPVGSSVIVSPVPGPQESISTIFHAHSSANSPIFLHSLPPPELAVESASPTPLSAPLSPPSPTESRIFAASSPLSALDLTPQHSGLVPFQAPAISPALRSYFHPVMAPEVAVRNSNPSSLLTPSSQPSPANPPAFSTTPSPIIAPDKRQGSYPAPSMEFAFPTSDVPSAAPGETHPHIVDLAPSPVYVTSPNVLHSQPPPSVLKPSAVPAPLEEPVQMIPPPLSNISVRSTHAWPPVSSAMSSSPPVSLADEHSPTSMQPPDLAFLPQPNPPNAPEPSLAPANSMPQHPSHPPLSSDPSPLPALKTWRPEFQNSPVALPRSRMGSMSSPHNAPILQAPSPVLSHDTNDVFVPASASYHSNNELSPASSPHYSMSPAEGLHSAPPKYHPKPFHPEPSTVDAATPVQVNAKLSSPSPQAAGGQTVPALPPMTIYFPPPNLGCHQICTDPFTSTPGPPCSCVMPMLVVIELGTALYSLFPLVSELARELAAGTYLAQDQVRIKGANTISNNLETTEIQANLVPLTQSFDKRTANFIAQRLWSHQVIINEKLFGKYSVLYIKYPGLPQAPLLRDPATPDSENWNGGNQGFYVKPLGVNIVKPSSKQNVVKKAIVAFSSVIAAVILAAVAWIVIIRISHHWQQYTLTGSTIGSSTTKRSGGDSAASSLGSLKSKSFASSLTACSGSSKTFTLVELEKATKNFKPERVIGEGGFGRVYWGILEDGTKVAVKVLTRNDQQGVREFAAEVEILSRLHHRNLVKLLGICLEENVRCLVYELIPNGSVEFHLHGDPKRPAQLNWEVRLKIALGSARGLAYLHEDSNPRVIHRDFKSSNILLEDNFNPKVSDFGLAKAASEEMGGHISTRVMGTFGYVAPEYAMTGHLLVKSDVYSYGVVLLELLSGRKPVDMSRPSGEENLVTWARPLLRSKEGLKKLADPNLGNNYPLENLVKVAAIASMCVHPEVSERPFMGEVVQALRLVYQDSEASDEALSQNESVGGESPSKRSDSTSSLIEALMSDSRYVTDGTSFITVDYDSGSLTTPDEGFQRPSSTSRNLWHSGGFFRRLTRSYSRPNGSGSLQTLRSDRAWYRVRHHQGGSLSDHSVGAQHADRHYYTDIWP